MKYKYGVNTFEGTPSEIRLQLYRFLCTLPLVCGDKYTIGGESIIADINLTVREIKERLINEAISRVPNKYKLIPGFSWKDKTFQRIQATQNFGDIKVGDIGGYVVDEHNLSQDGNCWINADSFVEDDAVVKGNAFIIGSKISGTAIVKGDVTVEKTEINRGVIQ